MRLSIFSVLFVVLSFSLSGCNLVDSPTDVVGSVYANLMKNDFGAFKAELSGNALAQYGTPEAAAALQQKLAGKKLHVGSANLISNTQVDASSWNRIYSVDVLETGSDGKNHVLTSAQVLCHVSGTSSGCDIQVCDLQPTTTICSVDEIPSI